MSTVYHELSRQVYIIPEPDEVVITRAVSNQSALSYRNNIAAARLTGKVGLQKGLKMNDTQYQTCVSILFVGYLLMRKSLSPMLLCPSTPSSVVLRPRERNPIQ